MAALSTTNVVTALHKVSITKTRELFFCLGVQSHVLDNIDMEHSGNNRTTKYIQAWLDRDKHASWKKLVSGLKEIDMNVLAEEVEATFISEASIPTTSSAPLISASPPPQLSVGTPAHLEAAPLPDTVAMAAPTPGPLIPAINPMHPPPISEERVAEVKAAIENFKEEFVDLTFGAQVFLSERESQDVKFLARFRDYLVELSVSETAIHVTFFHQHESDIRKAEKVEMIFDILREYSSYFNYDIILHLIENFCDDPLKKRMLEYRDSLESFEITTTVDIFRCTISAPPEENVFQAFSRMALTIKKAPAECTLHKIRVLKESLARDAYIHPYSVFIEESSMAEHSVLVVLRIPPSCVVWVGVAMTPDFMQAHHLTEVSIDGKDIKHYQSRKYLGSQLCDISRNGDVVGVVSLLSSGVDVDAMNWGEVSALMVAAMKGKTKVLLELVKAGANVEMQTEDGESALMKAARWGNTEGVVELVEAGANVNMQTERGDSALMMAASEGETKVVVELVKAGANVEMQNRDGDSALMEAARGGKTEVVVELVKAGANVDLQNKEGDSALMRAARGGKTEVVVELVKAGANVDMQNGNGESALTMAARGGNTEVIVELAKAGANVDLLNRRGDTALMEAARGGKSEAIVELVKAGANVEMLNRWGESSLMEAAKWGKTEVVVELVKAGANVDMQTEGGDTALMLAASEGKTESVVELVKAGANVDMQDKGGNSALIMATMEGRTKVVVELVKAGANVELQNTRGYTALMWAARCFKTEVIVELVKAGANVDMLDNRGYSALMEAASEGKTERVVELVKVGANVDMQNTKGDSAVIIATQYYRSEALKKLVASGANLNLQNQEGLTALMMSVRGKRTDLTDILLSGATIDPDIREDSTGWTALFFAAEAGDVASTQSLIRAGANARIKDKDGLTALDVAAAGGRATRGVRAELQKHIPAPPSRISQVLGLVKKSGQRIRQLFIQLNTRLNKSVDEKSRMGVKGQGSEGVQKI